MIFESRTSAGRLLAAEIAKRKYANPHVFALVRGGVPVGAQVASKLAVPLDVLVIRKLGLPSFPELGFGALAPDGFTEMDNTIVNRYRLRITDIEEVKAAEQVELKRRMEKYGVRPPLDLKGQTAIIVDDGIATGITTLAAVKYLRKFDPGKVVVAVPVCPDTSESQFRGLADDYVCLDYEEYFGAVGEFYESFPQVADEEVLTYLKIK